MHDLRVSSHTTRTLDDRTKAGIPDLVYALDLYTDATLGTSSGVDYGFDERLRVNEIGRLLTGQLDHFIDFLHPEAVPGSYLWGDVILYE